MLAPSTRTIVRVFYTVAASAATLYFCYLIRHVLGLVFIAGFLAVALGPPVGFFRQRLGLPPVVSILLVYVLIVMAIFGVGLLVVPPMVSQVQGLADDIPGYLQDLRKNDQFRKYDQKYDITTKLSQQARNLPSKLGSAVSTLRSVTVGVFSAIVALVTVLTMTFFLLRDGGRIVGFLFGLAGAEREQRLRRISGDVYRSVSGYVAGNMLISIIAGTTTYVTLTILGVPFAVPLAVLMAFLDLIPLIGATIGGVIVGIVTAFTDFPTSTIVWVIVFIVYQQVENNLLQPVIYRRTVDVHPLLVIVAILIGAGLLGILGALIAIPVAATVQIIARDEWEHRRGLSGPPPPGAGAAPSPPETPPPRPAPEPGPA
jgi:predicted PurR-regulated permease PerM